MKRYILAILLNAFVFITVHDFVLNSIDSDTQQELVLLENNKLTATSICDTSKVHHHLHESLISCQMQNFDISNDTICKTYVNSYKSQIVPDFTPLNLYRPPIV